jgi:hypothetical protein
MAAQSRYSIPVYGETPLAECCLLHKNFAEMKRVRAQKWGVL